MKSVNRFMNREWLGVCVIALNLSTVIRDLVHHTWSRWDWFFISATLFFCWAVTWDWRYWSRRHR